MLFLLLHLPQFPVFQPFLSCRENVLFLNAVSGLKSLFSVSAEMISQGSSALPGAVTWAGAVWQKLIWIEVQLVCPAGLSLPAPSQRGLVQLNNF